MCILKAHQAHLYFAYPAENPASLFGRTLESALLLKAGLPLVLVATIAASYGKHLGAYHAALLRGTQSPEDYLRERLAILEEELEYLFLFACKK